MSRIFRLYATVTEGGGLKIDRGALRKWLSTKVGKDVELSVKIARKTRSSEQNRYLWGVVYEHILRGLIEAGYDVPDSEEGKEIVHNFCKERFLPKIEIEKKEQPENFFTITGSTTNLDTAAFFDYTEKIIHFAAEYLGVAIPEPSRATFDDVAV